MHKDFPDDLLLCPRCRSELTVRAQDGFGTASCACDRMPIVAGIVISTDRALKARCLALLAAGNREGALDAILGKHAARVRWMKRLGIPVTFRRYLRHGAIYRFVKSFNLSRLLERAPPRKINTNLVAAATFHAYMRQRLASPWIESGLALLGLIDPGDKSAMVLDAGCGMGHLSFQLSKLVPQEQIVCLDLQPPFVYSAIRFFVPDARLAIAHDMSFELPLKDRQFALTVTFDAFQYLPDKRQAARELLRVVRDDGVVAIVHTPMPSRDSIYNGSPLELSEYADLFPGCDVKISPSRYLADAQLSRQPIDLAREFSADELSRAPAINVLVAKNPGVLRVIPNRHDELLARMREHESTLALSEQYRVDMVDGKAVFTADFLQTLGKEYDEFDEVLPRQYTVPADQVASRDGRLDFQCKEELLRKHILVQLPPEY